MCEQRSLREAERSGLAGYAMMMTVSPYPSKKRTRRNTFPKNCDKLTSLINQPGVVLDYFTAVCMTLSFYSCKRSCKTLAWTSQYYLPYLSHEMLYTCSKFKTPSHGDTLWRDMARQTERTETLSHCKTTPTADVSASVARMQHAPSPGWPS